MTNRFFALVLALCLTFTAVAPIAHAQAEPELSMSETELKKLFEQMQGGVIPDSIKSRTDEVKDAIGVDMSNLDSMTAESYEKLAYYLLGITSNGAGFPASSSESEIEKKKTENEKVYELETGASEVIALQSGQTPFFRFRINREPYSSNPNVAIASYDTKTQTMTPASKGEPTEFTVLYGVVHAIGPGGKSRLSELHSTGEADITFYFTLEKDESDNEVDEFYPIREYQHTIHVRVKDPLQPPIVEASMNVNETKLVTGYPKEVDDLKFLSDLPTELPAYLIPAKDLKEYAKNNVVSYAKDKVQDWVVGQILNQLKKIREERVSPEVYLTLTLTNPNPRAILGYEIEVFADRASTLLYSTQYYGADGTPYEDNNPPTTKIGVLSPNGLPYRSTYKIKPELIYEGGSYDTTIHYRIKWGERSATYYPEPTEVIEGSLPLRVVSELGHPSMYNQREQFFSKLALPVFLYLYGLTELPDLTPTSFSSPLPAPSVPQAIQDQLQAAAQQNTAQPNAAAEAQRSAIRTQVEQLLLRDSAAQ